MPFVHSHRTLPWLLAGAGAALCTAILDTALLYMTTGAGNLSYFAMALALHGMMAAPVAFGLATVTLKPRQVSLSRRAFAFVCVVLAGLVIAGAYAVQTQVAKLKPEFPHRLAELRVGVILGLAAAACVLGAMAVRRTPSLPAAVRTVVRHPISTVAFFGVGAVYAMFLAYDVLEPLHLTLVAGACDFATVLGLTVAIRALDPRATTRITYGNWSVIALLWVLLPLRVGPWNNAEARFTLFNHSPAAGWMAARLRDVTDFDHDRSAPTWALGNDCAPFDGAVGPLRTDTPGDGVDQDCSGADAPVRPSTPKHSRDGRCVPPGNLSILFITVDAMRADALRADVTPAMAAFAERGLWFTRAYAGASFTYHSMFVLSSGLTVTDLRNDITGAPMAKGQHLAGILRRFGYATAAFRPVELPEGLLKGFDYLWAAPPSPTNAIGHSAPALSDAAERWILAQNGHRFFAWLHYADAHAPYDPVPTASNAPGATTPYLKELHFVDTSVDKLLGDLRTAGVLDHTAVLLSADHGEDLGHHGHEGHGVDAYEDTVHVPLALWVPGCTPARIDAPVTHADVAATAIRMAGYEPGRATLLGPTTRPYVVSEVFADELLADEHRYKRALVDGNHKLIHDVRNGTFALFDLAADPHERHNRADADPQTFQRLLAEYHTWLDTHGR